MLRNRPGLRDPRVRIGHDSQVTISVSPLAPFARIAGALLCLAALLAVMVASASPASAHARLESSSPTDGATLTAVPPEIMLRFNEPIKDELNEVSVSSGSTDVTDGAMQVEGSSAFQPVKYSMEPGKYTVSYKVVSADGHPVSGSFSFTYDPPEGDTGAGADPSASDPSSSGSSSKSTSATSGSGSSSSSGSSSDAPSSDSSSTSSSDSSSTSAEPSESSSSTSGTSAPSSTSSPESTSSSPSEEPSGTSSSSSSSAAAVDEADETTGGEGTSPWWWAVAAGALAVILGGVALLVRGRRGSGDDEEVTLEEWRE